MKLLDVARVSNIFLETGFIPSGRTESCLTLAIIPSRIPHIGRLTITAAGVSRRCIAFLECDGEMYLLSEKRVQHEDIG